MNARFVRHVTLTTGHARDSRPGEVSPEAVTLCRDLIECATAGKIGEPVAIPNVGPYSINGRRSGKCLSLSVYADGPPSELLCTVGIASHSRCGATLWRNLHAWAQMPVATDAASPPPEPWVAAALHPGIGKHMDATEWLGDFERCLAWAWLEIVNNGR